MVSWAELHKRQMQNVADASIRVEQFREGHPRDRVRATVHRQIEADGIAAKSDVLHAPSVCKGDPIERDRQLTAEIVEIYHGGITRARQREAQRCQ
jgi:hypothetical protein